MSVRTKLIVAFLLLAVVPLTGIVLYSYVMSERAVRRAVWGEIQALAVETGERLASTREELGTQLGSLTQLPELALIPRDGAEADAGRAYSDLMSELGSAANVVEVLEYIPESDTGTALAEGDIEISSSAESLFIFPSDTLAEALVRLEERKIDLEDSGITPQYLEEMVREVVQVRRNLSEENLEALEAGRAQTERLLGRGFSYPVMREGRQVGTMQVQLPVGQVLQDVLVRMPREGGEIPFAIDSEGTLYVGEEGDRARLAEVGVTESDPGSGSIRGDWIMAKTADDESGLTFGVARPIRESLREIRDTALRNFAVGLAMIAASLAGVLILSGRMTRNLTLLTAGAERLAAGDLESRVSLRSNDEFGQLADTFNRMAQEVSLGQKRLLDGERLRRDQEVQQRLLEVENERKSGELEEARQFQLSLLPKSLPELPDLDIAVFMNTATEVGGDYYDFFPAGNGSITAAIGDAAGHGAKAGTMVTVVKGLLTASAGREELPEILRDATRAIRQMGLRRMNMAVTLVRIAEGTLSIAAAGMPPVLLYRAGLDSVSELALAGMPLGSFAETPYQKRVERLSPGDTALLMTDGFPELLNGDQEPLGYGRARSLFKESAAKKPKEIIVDLAAAASDWTGGMPPRDDITFVVLKMKG